MGAMKYCFLLVLVSLFGCRKNLDEVTWDTDILTPIAYAELSIENLTEDLDNVSYGSNGLVYLTYEEALFSYNPLDTLELNVDPFLRELTLEILQLADQSFSENFNFGDLIINQGFETTLPDGSGQPAWLFALVPPITNLDPIQMDISDYFEYAVLSQGYLTIDIDNQFPIDITELTFEIRNSVSGNTLYTNTFNNIETGTSVSDHVDLYDAIGDTPIEGILDVVVTNLDIGVPAGATTIHIDYADFLNFTVSLTDIKVQSAKAIFPDQNVIDHTNENELQDMGDLKLKAAVIDSGYVLVNVKSSIETELYLDYSISSAILDGAPFAFSEVVPAALPGGISEIYNTYPVNDFYLDLTGDDGLKVNTFVNTIVGSIRQTTTPVDITLQDTIFVEISIADLKTSQIKGYVGQVSFQFGPESVNMNLFDALDVSLLNFREATIDLNFDNGMGIAGNGDVNYLKSMNNTTLDSYTSSPVIGAVLESASGNMGNPQIVNSQINISNEVGLINVNPDLLEYDVSFNLNPNGNIPAYSNFANKAYPIEGSIRVEVPLDVKIENLQLIDTFEFVREDFALVDNINESSLIINIENDYPLSANTQLYFLDQNEVVVDSIIIPDIIDAALVGSDGRTVEAALFRYKETVSSGKLDRILSSMSIRSVINFNTSPSTQHVQFYQDYLFKVRIASDLNFRVESRL